MTPGSLKIRFPRLPVSIQFTREGLIFVLLSLAIGAAAVNTGNNILYLIFSLMLGMIVVSGILSKRMLLGLKAKVDFPEYVFSGVRNLCYVTVSNGKKRLPSLAIRFRINQDSFARVSRYFFFINPAAEVSGYAPLIFAKRGVYRLQEMELQTRAPFSFFTKIRRLSADSSLKVYPRVYRLSEELVSRVSEGFILDSPFRGESHQLLHLRDYTPFDSSRRIHWKASAKTEKLLSKEYQKEQGRDLFLYYDCYPQHPDRANAAEDAISLIASLAFFVADRGIQAEVIFGEQRFKIGARNQSLVPLLDFLAEFDPMNSTDVSQASIAHPASALLIVRSRSIPAHLTPGGAYRVLFIEDWIQILKDNVSEVA